MVRWALYGRLEPQHMKLVVTRAKFLFAELAAE